MLIAIGYVLMAVLFTATLFLFAVLTTEVLESMIDDSYPDPAPNDDDHGDESDRARERCIDRDGGVW